MIDISVIVVSKNEEKYIGNALEKLIEAGGEARKRNITTETIVVDSSTDNTFRQAKKITENVYAFLPQGLTKARNYGASLARGRILVFMDADTVIQRTSLIDIFNDFRDGATVAIISCVLPLYRQRSFSNILFYLIDEKYVKSCAYVKFLVKFYNRGDLTAIRKDIFSKVNGFDEKLHMLDITDLLLKASSYGKIGVLSTPVFESSRRLKKWGMLKSYKIWWKNYVSFYILKHLSDSTYEEVR